MSDTKTFVVNKYEKAMTRTAEEIVKEAKEVDVRILASVIVTLVVDNDTDLDTAISDLAMTDDEAGLKLSISSVALGPMSPDIVKIMLDAASELSECELVAGLLVGPKKNFKYDA